MSRALTWILLASVLSLACFSGYLATRRIYQVDECQYIYMAKVLSTRQEKTFFSDASGFTLPISWLAGKCARSADLFTSARFVMVGLFWLNLLLIALNTGAALRSRQGLIALVMAATLAPLWDYGFEIRHDNVLLTGLLLMWFVLRVHPGGFSSYFVAGALAVAMEFVAFKSFAYTIPLSMGCLLFPPAAHAASRQKLVLGWISGGITAFLAARFTYGQMGLWQVYLTDFHGISGASAHTSRFAPWGTLARLLTQTPLLLALVLAALLAVLADLRARGRAALTWGGNLPEALLFLGATGVLFINPTPFPYNLLQLVPFAFIFAFRYARDLVRLLVDHSSLVPVMAGIVIFVHVVPFWAATRRHLERPNTRQEQLMSLAEALTDPQKDPVYDAVGMVPSRPSIGFRWFLHSLNIQSFLDGSQARVCDMLAARPAAVYIPSYRTDWLPELDHHFISERYVSLADDFWVLGKVLPSGGGTFEIFHPGRYRISTLKGSDLQGTYELNSKACTIREAPGALTATLDGSPLPDLPVQLAVGMHTLECPTNCQPAVVWIGPRLERVHRIGAGDHRTLFFNWY